MQPEPEQFVTVSPDGSHLTLGAKPFYFAGANCYYLLTRAADPATRHQVVEVLDAAKQAGLTVVRTWAFCDGDEWNALQPRPGEFDERVFQGLDFVVHEAGRRGLKLMLVLTNFWNAYGGMAQYVRWSCARRNVPVTDKAELFYADPCCQDVFQNFLVTITSRVNTHSKLAYRDDPTIMCWVLANEPRCPGDYAASVLQAWIAPIAEFLKSIDPNHLITLGAEGYLGSSTPELIIDNPHDTLGMGCDFLRHHMCEHIDFATIHLWPDSWLPHADEDHKLRFARRWINSHVDACALLGKPLVIAEFGKKNEDGLRAAFFDKVYSVIVHHARAGRFLAGSCYWMLAAASYPDYDGFTVYLSPPTAADAASKLEAEVCAAQIAERLRQGAASPRTPAIQDRVATGLAGNEAPDMAGPVPDHGDAATSLRDRDSSTDTAGDPAVQASTSGPQQHEHSRDPSVSPSQPGDRAAADSSAQAGSSERHEQRGSSLQPLASHQIRDWDQSENSAASTDRDEVSSEGGALDADWVTPSKMASSDTAQSPLARSHARTVELILQHAADMHRLNGGEAAGRDCIVM